MDISQLRQRASALGFSFERGLKKGAGYVLVNANGDRPLGTNYSASLADIEKYLDDHADDLDVDVEVTGEESKPPPTSAETRKSLGGHANANEIKEVLTPPPSTRQEQRDRIALDGLLSMGTNARSAMAFDQSSEAEKEKYRANLQAALAKEEKAKAAKLPKPTLPLRETGLNSDHPLAAEKARQGRVFQNANRQLKTNIGSLRDYNSDYYREEAFYNGLPRSELVRELERERLKNAPPPESGAYDPAPKPVTGFAVTAKRGRPSNADIQKRQAEWQQKQRLDEIAEAVRRRLRDKRTPKRDAEVGALLVDARALLGRGALDDWIETVPMSRSAAYGFLAKADPAKSSS
jgi:hypothetical protein